MAVQAFTRSYYVYNISTTPGQQLQVTLIQDDGVDVNGAPIGTNTVNLLMSTEEARGYFPGDKVTVTLAPDTTTV